MGNTVVYLNFVVRFDDRPVTGKRSALKVVKSAQLCILIRWLVKLSYGSIPTGLTETEGQVKVNHGSRPTPQCNPRSFPFKKGPYIMYTVNQIKYSTVAASAWQVAIAIGGTTVTSLFFNAQNSRWDQLQNELHWEIKEDRTKKRNTTNIYWLVFYRSFDLVTDQRDTLNLNLYIPRWSLFLQGPINHISSQICLQKGEKRGGRYGMKKLW